MKVNTPFILLLVIFLFGKGVFAQPFFPDYKLIEVNNIRTGINADGLLFWNHVLGPGIQNFEVPKGSGRSTIFAASLWIGGFDPMGNLHMAAQTYKQDGTDFYPGPLNPVTGAAENPHLWNRVWSVTKEEIDNHIRNWNRAGYQMPASIKEWPANGIPGSTVPHNTAPFFDVNNNGIYEPHLGEFPYIKGDEALYVIYNDNYTIHGETGAQPMKIEVQAMLYGYKNEPGLENTLFGSFRVFNRSTENYSDVFLGMWTDFDIGFSGDDYVGTYRKFNMIYGYNGSNYDPGHTGYGESPPAQAMVFLNRTITRSRAYRNEWSIDGNPSRASQYYAVLKGLRNNMQQQYEMGIPVDFSFNGNACDSTGSTEFNLGNFDGDRRMMASTGPFVFEAGTSQTLDVAFVYARNANGHIHSVCDLMDAVEVVKAKYKSDLITSVELTNQKNTSFLKISPNPVMSISKIEIQLPINEKGNLYVIDLMGRIVIPELSGNTISSNQLSPGYYKLVYKSNRYFQSVPFIVH